MTIKLPKDFFFGAAMSGPQTEGSCNVGGRLRSYWDMYSNQEINVFYNNVGSYIENDWKIGINRRVGDEAILSQGEVGWLGFNYYQPTHVQAPDSQFDENGLPCISKPYIWTERKMNVHRG